MAGRHGEEEFDEGEVWDVLQEDQSKEAAALTNPTPARTPPWNRSSRAKNKAAVPKEEGGAAAARNKGRSSAPVAIPSRCSSRRGCGGGEGGVVDEEEEEEEEEEGGEMLPPHEWLARKMEMMSGALAGASSPEICRGRSKGREMRKVRDAVLPKTAFSDQ